MQPLPSPERTRRDDVPAHPIVLADGRAWWFARPSTLLKPAFASGLDRVGRPGESVAVLVVVEYPLEIRRRLDAVRAALTGSDADSLETLFELAAALLRRAHDVDPATAAALLDLGDDLPRFALELLAVAAGEPRPSPDLPEGNTHV